MEVIQYLLTVRSNAEISGALGITERTVKSHITSIFNKLGVDNRAQLGYVLKDHASPPVFPEECAPVFYHIKIDTI